MENIQTAWRKPFFTMFFGQVFSIFGSNIVQFAITVYLALRTNSAIILTLAMLAGYLPQVVLGPIIGAFVDRSNRKTTMMLADMFVAIASAVLMVAFFLGEPPFYFIFIILMLRSLGQGFHEPALLASIPMLVGKDHLTRVGGYRQAVDSLAIILAPSISALLLSIMPIAYIMIVDIAGALIANVILLFWVRIPNPPAVSPVSKTGFFKGLASDVLFGVRELAKTKGLVILALALACATFIYVPISTLFILLVTQNFNGGKIEIATVQAAFGIGMLLGSLLLGQFGKLKRRVLFMCLTLIVMGIILLVASWLPPALFILLVALAGIEGLLFPIMSSPIFAMLQTLIRPSVLGRVTALVKSVITLATPLGLLLAGPISELLGVGMWFKISGLFIVVLGVVCISFPSIKKLDDLMEQHRQKA
ncbi:MAG: MFS transporter [Christensenellales bacterium]|jgi:DHA3 family macrolide efflux protein-like MFS transporter